jgi:proline iminopeptidase
MLVMHGGPGLDHTYLRPGLDPLGDAVELIYYDHRGNGRSPDPEEWDAVSHDSWARDADALRARLGHERVLLFGHSYGGFLALEYALRFPERLRGLILCDTAPALDYPEVVAANARARGTPEQVEAALAGFSEPAADDDALRDLWLTILPLYFHDYRPAYAEQSRDILYRAAAFNHAFFRCVAEYDVRERLDGIDVATLILVGRDDWIAPVAEGAERIHAGLPRSELRVFEHSGHFPFVEEPERFRSTVREWLDGGL